MCSSDLIQEQAQKGNWDFRLNAVYFVAILDFLYDTEEDRKKFFREISLKDQDGELFYDKLYQYFFQMPLFNKQESELKTQSEKWFYFLRNLDSFDDIPSILRVPVFERAFATAETSRLSKEERRQYEADLKIYRDNYAVMKTAVDTSREEGRAEGHAEGEAKGRTEGKIETAQNLKRLGVPLATIAEATGLSESEIERL